MYKSNNLFQLIKSMTRGEKKHFKLASKKHLIDGGSDYLRLFELLDKSEFYDEDAIIEKLKGAIDSKGFSSKKYHLYNLILKNLREYHSNSKNKSARIALQESWTNIYILLDKGLIKQAISSISKARKIAALYQFKLDHIKLNILERRLVVEFDRKHILKRILPLRDEYKKLLKHLTEEEVGVTYFENAFIEVRNRGELGMKQIPSGWERYYRTVKQSYNRDTAFWRFVYVNYVYALRQENLFNDFESASFYWKSIIEEFEKDDVFKREYQDRYLNLLNNYFGNCINRGKLDEIPLLIEKLIAIQARTLNNDIKKEQHVCYYNLLYFLIRKDYEKAISLSAEINKLLSKYARKITPNRKIIFLYSMGIAFFMKGINSSKKEHIRYLEESRDWFYRIEKEPKFETRKDLKKLTKMFLTLVHFELGNEFHVEYLINSGLQYLKKEKSSNSVEAIILKGLKKILNIVEQEKRKVVFEELITKLKDYKGIEELIEWLKVKATTGGPNYS